MNTYYVRVSYVMTEVPPIATNTVGLPRPDSMWWDIIHRFQDDVDEREGIHHPAYVSNWDKRQVICIADVDAETAEAAIEFVRTVFAETWTKIAPPWVINEDDSSAHQLSSMRQAL